MRSTLAESQILLNWLRGKPAILSDSTLIIEVAITYLKREGVSTGIRTYSCSILSLLEAKLRVRQWAAIERRAIVSLGESAIVYNPIFIL